LPLPARGAIYKRFGEEAQGQAGRGIVVETRQRAAVVAPHDGQVVYAGEFRGYGLVLILEHGEGYHLLLAGLARIDCAAGQWVLAGEPVGVMGGAGAESQRLYIELRRQGHPIDPLSWLVPDKDKVG
jgi:septal ring factor EnvC (AmiA/AmiB activator)